MDFSLETFRSEGEIELVRGVRLAIEFIRTTAVDRWTFTIQTVTDLKAERDQSVLLEEANGQTNLKIGEWIGLFQCFDGELQEACRSLNVCIVAGILLMNQGDFPLDLFVNVGDEFLFLSFQWANELIDIFDQSLLEDFAIFLQGKKVILRGFSLFDGFARSIVFIIIIIISSISMILSRETWWCRYVALASYPCMYSHPACTSLERGKMTEGEGEKDSSNKVIFFEWWI